MAEVKSVGDHTRDNRIGALDLVGGTTDGGSNDSLNTHFGSSPCISSTDSAIKEIMKFLESNKPLLLPTAG